jgi:hypothetical protein
MKKLYYTIDIDFNENVLSTDISELYPTGNKTVTVYEIEVNENYEAEMKKFFSLDLVLSDNSEEEINNYLEDNGHGDEEFKLVLL